MFKIIKERIPNGCIIIEKEIMTPMNCPVEDKAVKLALRFLDSAEGTGDESYVLIDKKVTSPIFLNVIKKLISDFMPMIAKPMRLDNDIVSNILVDDNDNQLVAFDLGANFSIIGEKIASKLSNLSNDEIVSFSGFGGGYDPSEVINVRQVGGSYKPSGESSFFDGLKNRNADLKRWNTSNSKFLTENNIPYAPEEKHGFLSSLKEAHSMTSSVAGAIGDVNATIDGLDKLYNWWEKYKTSKAFKNEERVSKQKVFERNRLNSMFFRSNLKKVENDGFESLKFLTGIYNMGFSNILRAPHYFKPEYLKVLFSICSICVSNALPSNKIIDIRMSLSDLQGLYSRLERKYGAAQR